MSGRGVDLLLINPGDRKQIYQGLGSDLAAVEPPVWVGILATFMRNRGYSVRIIDANAENWDPDTTAEKAAAHNPLLTAVIVYGSQPSASTQTMPSAGRICSAIKRRDPDQKVLLGGLHVSALPERTMDEEEVDFVCEGEGPHTIQGLVDLLKAGSDRFQDVPGLWRRANGKVHSTPSAPLIEDLATDMPGAAWDLLPMDKYRAHNWHCFDRLHERNPYAVLYTSLGCPFHCTFCCINAPFGGPGIRYRDPENVIEEIDWLVRDYGVRNIKILDEMFVLNPAHVRDLCNLIIERGYDLNIWAYARVDTVRDDILEMLNRAGFHWLALGIESGSKHVREGAEKDFKRHDIKAVIRKIQSAGINVIGNYIFGLPDDSLDTMRETLDLALELNCEFANFYSAMAYPGSPLYRLASENGWRLPASWSGYSQHAVDTLPLPTHQVSAAEVLGFRDDAFHTYFSNPAYLRMVEEKFGLEIADHIRSMASRRLERRLVA